MFRLCSAVFGVPWDGKRAFEKPILERAARLAVVERELQDASLSPDRRSVLASEADVLRSLRASEER